MIFIVIGPDMAGKTTLAKNLALLDSSLNYQKFSHYPTPEESVTAAENFTTTVLQEKTPEKIYLLDRFHYPDDLVYGPATNRYDLPEGVMRRYLIRVHPTLVALQTAYIYCHAPIAVLTQRYAERGDDYIVPEYLPKIISNYKNWLTNKNNVNLPMLTLDSHMFSPEEMVLHARAFIEGTIHQFTKARKVL